jgi:hypothetical protein
MQTPVKAGLCEFVCAYFCTAIGPGFTLELRSHAPVCRPPEMHSQKKAAQQLPLRVCASLTVLCRAPSLTAGSSPLTASACSAAVSPLLRLLHSRHVCQATSTPAATRKGRDSAKNTATLTVASELPRTLRCYSSGFIKIAVMNHCYMV